MRIDLHTHSTRSDGTVPPAGLVRAAREAGLDVVALTDHDTTAGWAEATAAGVEEGVAVVPGIELSTRFEHRSVHLLAYFVDPHDAPLAAEMARVVAGREGRAPQLIALLNEAGVDLTADELAAATPPGAVPGRPHVADALVRRGLVADRDEAFRTWLGPQGRAFVRRYATALEDALALVRDAGGVAVIAHPRGRGSRAVLTDEAIAGLRGLGLAGLEVDHQDHAPDVRRDLRALARDLDLVVTGSSDWHGAGKADHDLGCNTTDPEQYARLRALAGVEGAAR